MKRIWIFFFAPCVALSSQACETDRAQVADEVLGRNAAEALNRTSSAPKAGETGTNRDSKPEADRDISSRNLEEALDRLEEEIRSE